MSQASRATEVLPTTLEIPAVKYAPAQMRVASTAMAPVSAVAKVKQREHTQERSTLT